MPIRLVSLALCLAACADEPELLALPEVCGAPGPVRVLELPADQELLYEPLSVGERVFYEVGDLESQSQRPKRWTTGPCGESPTLLPDRLGEPFTVDRWPELVLVCDRETNSIVSLAPSGPLAPLVLLPDSGCRPLWSAFGPIVQSDVEDPGDAIRLYRWPDDPRARIAEYSPLTDVRVRAAGLNDSLQLAGDRLFALTPLNELVRIELPGGDVTIEQTDVSEFTASADGRHLLIWQNFSGDPNEPATAALRDVETGVSVGLGLGRLWDNNGALVNPGHLVFDSEPGPTRIYRLPGLDSVEVPEGYQVHGVAGLNIDNRPLADGRWILHGIHAPTLRYLDPATREVEPMVDEFGAILVREPAGVVVLQAVPSTWGQWDWFTSEGPLWYVRFDGAPAELLARRSTVSSYLPNPDQLLTAIDIDGERRGTLVLLDRGDLRERVLDHHVNALVLTSHSAHPEADLIRYSVQDGARSGVWLARLR